MVLLCEQMTALRHATFVHETARNIKRQKFSWHLRRYFYFLAVLKIRGSESCKESVDTNLQLRCHSFGNSW